MGFCYKSESDRIKNELPFYKSLCKINYQGKNAYGFLIKLLKKNEDFFCLITSENFGKINSEKLIFHFDNEKQSREIILDPNERHIEYLSEINIDLTVIEVLQKDNIPLNFFLLPDLDYENNINELLNKDIKLSNYDSENLFVTNEKILTVKKNEFSFSSKKSLCSSGYPIFLKNNTKVIGININKIGPENNNKNNGYFIIPIFNYFKNHIDKSEESSKSIPIEEEPDNGMPPIVNKLINFPKYYDYISDKKIDLNNIPNICLNQINLIYLIDKKSNTVRLFCGDFVKNNEDKCYLIIDGNKHALVNKLSLNETQKSKKNIEVKLIEYKPITDMSFMFFDCSSLILIPGIKNWNTENVTKMNSMFNGCISLKYLAHLSDWDTSKVTDMSCMFLGCIALQFIGGIDNWNIKNVKKMNSMFAYCRSLLSIPDISKWDTKNVINMNWMFLRCESLRIFPDISNWKLNKNLQNIMMFAGCQKDIIPEKFKK